MCKQKQTSKIHNLISGDGLSFKLKDSVLYCTGPQKSTFLQFWPVSQKEFPTPDDEEQSNRSFVSKCWNFFTVEVRLCPKIVISEHCQHVQAESIINKRQLGRHLIKAWKQVCKNNLPRLQSGSAAVKEDHKIKASDRRKDKIVSSQNQGSFLQNFKALI